MTSLGPKLSLACLVALAAALLATTSSLRIPVAAAVNHGDIQVHDPSMSKDGRTYYVFSTGGGIHILKSTNLVTWQDAGTVFRAIPTWVTNDVGPIQDLWAPDISYWNGLYHLYYVGSTFGTNTSVIGLATNRTLDRSSRDYRWVDHGLVIMSTSMDTWNAIDPNFVLDSRGTPWLDFGSFWSGIKLRRLDIKTGKPSRSDTKLYSLAARSGAGAIEAPFIVRRGGYYYLFVSVGFCCRGAQSTYHIMVGRSTRMTGPYVDKSGRRMMNDGGSLILAGQGGQSILLDGHTYLLVYHYYDALDNGVSKLQIRPLVWTGDAWPRAGQAMLS